MADTRTQRPATTAAVLGAGYAGVSVAKAIRRRDRSGMRVVLVDRAPVHVLRTELYQVDEIAAAASTDGRKWALPIAKVLASSRIEFRQGTVTKIDLPNRRVELADGELGFDFLAICLGSVPSYFGIPGAREHAQEVYSLSGAQRLGAAMVEAEKASARAPGALRPEIVVAGGGSTGTEVAAEIATANWTRICGTSVPDPHVTLLTGPTALLEGFSPALRRRSRELLERAGVEIREDSAVVRVDTDRLTLSDGTVVPFRLCVWCAGVEAPPVVAGLPIAHGKGKRIRVNSNLEVPQFPGVFGVGDVIEYQNPGTGVLVPATAQAALAEAPVAGYNLVARSRGEPMREFTYHERGVIISVGLRRAAGAVGRLTLWGRPAAILKDLVEATYARAAERA
jgi:NADH dehydrogenase